MEFTKAVAWIVAAILLLTGWRWAQVLVALGFAYSAWLAFHGFARGFAEGRKAAQLAAAPEYVHGRVAPTRADYAAAALFAGVSRIIPALIIIYAFATLL